METIKWVWIDKSTWGEGAWNEECDKLQWEDPQTGMPCLIVRNELSGSLCGYVGVTPDHPFFGIGYQYCAKRWCEKSYCDVSLAQLLKVHGGLTYSGMCTEDEDGHGICHVPGPGEESEIWWLGFDNSHFMDYSPALEAHLRSLRATMVDRISTTIEGGTDAEIEPHHLHSGTIRRGRVDQSSIEGQSKEQEDGVTDSVPSSLSPVEYNPQKDSVLASESVADGECIHMLSSEEARTPDGVHLETLGTGLSCLSSGGASLSSDQEAPSTSGDRSSESGGKVRGKDRGRRDAQTSRTPGADAQVEWKTQAVSDFFGVSRTYRTLDYVQSECRKLALQLDDRDWKERLESMDCTEKESA